MITGNTHIRREPSFYDVMSDKILSTVYRTDHPYEQAMLLGKRKFLFSKTLRKRMICNQVKIFINQQMNLVLLFFRINFNLIKFFRDVFHLIQIQLRQVSNSVYYKITETIFDFFSSSNRFISGI
jgi:hypothetical protein